MWVLVLRCVDGSVVFCFCFSLSWKEIVVNKNWREADDFF